MHDGPSSCRCCCCSAVAVAHLDVGLLVVVVTLVLDAEADAAAVASSRCPGVATVVPRADVMMLVAVASADTLVARRIKKFLIDRCVKLMKPVAQTLSDVRMLDHAHDAGDAHVLR